MCAFARFGIKRLSRIEMDKPDPRALAETVVKHAGPGAAVDLANLLREVLPDRVRAVLVQLPEGATG